MGEIQDLLEELVDIIDICSSEDITLDIVTHGGAHSHELQCEDFQGQRDCALQTPCVSSLDGTELNRTETDTRSIITPYACGRSDGCSNISEVLSCDSDQISTRTNLSPNRTKSTHMRSPVRMDAPLPGIGNQFSSDVQSHCLTDDQTYLSNTGALLITDNIQDQEMDGSFTSLESCTTRENADSAGSSTPVQSISNCDVEHFEAADYAQRSAADLSHTNNRQMSEETGVNLVPYLPNNSSNCKVGASSRLEYPDSQQPAQTVPPRVLPDPPQSHTKHGTIFIQFDEDMPVDLSCKPVEVFPRHAVDVECTLSRDDLTRGTDPPSIVQEILPRDCKTDQINVMSITSAKSETCSNIFQPEKPSKGKTCTKQSDRTVYKNSSYIASTYTKQATTALGMVILKPASSKLQQKSQETTKGEPHVELQLSDVPQKKAVQKLESIHISQPYSIAECQPNSAEGPHSHVVDKAQQCNKAVSPQDPSDGLKLQPVFKSQSAERRNSHHLQTSRLNVIDESEAQIPLIEGCTQDLITKPSSQYKEKTEIHTIEGSHIHYVKKSQPSLTEKPQQQPIEMPESNPLQKTQSKPEEDPQVRHIEEPVTHRNAEESLREVDAHHLEDSQIPTAEKIQLVRAIPQQHPHSYSEKEVQPNLNNLPSHSVDNVKSSSTEIENPPSKSPFQSDEMKKLRATRRNMRKRALAIVNAMNSKGPTNDSPIYIKPSKQTRISDVDFEIRNSVPGMFPLEQRGPTGNVKQFLIPERVRNDISTKIRPITFNHPVAMDQNCSTQRYSFPTTSTGIAQIEPDAMSMIADESVVCSTVHQIPISPPGQTANIKRSCNCLYNPITTCIVPPQSVSLGPTNECLKRNQPSDYAMQMHQNQQMMHRTGQYTALHESPSNYTHTSNPVQTPHGILNLNQTGPKEYQSNNVYSRVLNPVLCDEYQGYLGLEAHSGERSDPMQQIPVGQSHNMQPSQRHFTDEQFNAVLQKRNQSHAEQARYLPRGQGLPIAALSGMQGHVTCHSMNMHNPYHAGSSNNNSKQYPQDLQQHPGHMANGLPRTKHSTPNNCILGHFQSLHRLPLIKTGEQEKSRRLTQVTHSGMQTDNYAAQYLTPAYVHDKYANDATSAAIYNHKSHVSYTDEQVKQMYSKFADEQATNSLMTQMPQTDERIKQMYAKFADEQATNSLMMQMPRMGRNTNNRAQAVGTIHTTGLQSRMNHNHANMNKAYVKPHSTPAKSSRLPNVARRDRLVLKDKAATYMVADQPCVVQSIEPLLLAPTTSLQTDNSLLGKDVHEDIHWCSDQLLSDARTIERLPTAQLYQSDGAEEFVTKRRRKNSTSLCASKTQAKEPIECGSALCVQESLADDNARNTPSRETKEDSRLNNRNIDPVSKIPSPGFAQTGGLRDHMSMQSRILGQMNAVRMPGTLSRAQGTQLTTTSTSNRQDTTHHLKVGQDHQVPIGNMAHLSPTGSLPSAMTAQTLNALAPSRSTIVPRSLCHGVDTSPVIRKDSLHSALDAIRALNVDVATVPSECTDSDLPKAVRNDGTLIHITCSGCKERASFLCSRCKKVAYCSRTCQFASWQRHKIRCSV